MTFKWVEESCGPHIENIERAVNAKFDFRLKSNLNMCFVKEFWISLEHICQEFI
jgi:hypothetical protein